MQTGCATGDDRTAVSYSDVVWIQCRKSLHRPAVLAHVQHEACPALVKLRIRDECIACKHSALFWPVESQVAGRVAWCVDDLERSDLVAGINPAIYHARLLPQKTRGNL